MKIALIAAVAANNVIGYKGEIPWYSKEELKFFKKTTMGYPVVMGRVTFESIGKILPGRLNIVITSKKIPLQKNLLKFNSFPEAVKYCENKSEGKIFVIGGEKLYNEAIDYADEIVLSRISLTVKGDRYFPEIDQSAWKIEKKTECSNFTTFYYKRIVR